MSSEHGKAASRAWMRSEQKKGGRATRPVLLLNLLGVALAIGQARCAGSVLAIALTRQAGKAMPFIVGFAALALLRAALSIVAEKAAFNAGAAARRRLRTDALARLLHAGPSQLRVQHTGELTATVVD